MGCPRAGAAASGRWAPPRSRCCPPATRCGPWAQRWLRPALSVRLCRCLRLWLAGLGSCDRPGERAYTVQALRNGG